MIVDGQVQAAPIAHLAIGRDPLRITAILPVTVSFPDSVQIVSGDKEAAPLGLAWRRCPPGGCLVDASLSEDLLRHWCGSAEPGKIHSPGASLIRPCGPP